MADFKPIDSKVLHEALPDDDMRILNIEEDAQNILVELEIEKKPQICPGCGATVSRLHDRRPRWIEGGNLEGKHLRLYLKRRRMHCPKCGKRFPEEVNWISKYQRMTKSLQDEILSEENRTESRIMELSEEHFLSPTQIRHTWKIDR